jgi:tetratricopeptide (TPR) repeat protein
LFREGQLDDAIVELQWSLTVNPYYATGYSNLGFLYLRRGQFEPAVDCLLRALELDPQHNDAADHLFDVLRALIDELVLIGLTDGFLSALPEAEAFDEYHRHRRTRDIGLLICRNSTTLPFAWQGIQRWNPPVAVPRRRDAEAASQQVGRGP